MNTTITIVYCIRILYDRQLIKAYQEFMIFVRYLYYILCHLLQILWYSTRVTLAQSLQIENYPYQLYHFEIIPFSTYQL